MQLAEVAQGCRLQVVVCTWPLAASQLVPPFVGCWVMMKVLKVMPSSQEAVQGLKGVQDPTQLFEVAQGCRLQVIVCT